MCCVLGMNIFIHCAETGRVLSLKVSVLGNFLELFHWCLPALSFYFFLWFSQSVMSNSLQPHGLQHAQAPLSFTISWSLLKFMSIESVRARAIVQLLAAGNKPPLFPLSASFPSPGRCAGSLLLLCCVSLHTTPAPLPRHSPKPSSPSM